MGATTLTLAALKVTVRGGGATLTGCQLVGVHAQAHGAAGESPIGTEVLEDLVQAFCFCLRAHLLGAGHDHHAHVLGDGAATHDVGRGAIGYAQFARALEDSEYSVEQAIEDTTIATRQFARRQLTWFRGDERVHWLDALSPTLADEAEAIIRESTR